MKISRHQGFTLIELLIVISLIAILAAIVIGTAGFVRENAARSRAKAEIGAIANALESYKVDHGQYPIGTNENTGGSVANTILSDALCPTNGKVYMEFNKGQTNSTRTVVDPFGNAYGYRYPGTEDTSGTNFFDLWSTGNKPNNSASWIKNW